MCLLLALVLGVTNLIKPFFIGKMYERKFANKIHRVFHAGGGGGKNAKFHRLNLLGAALRNIGSYELYARDCLAPLFQKRLGVFYILVRKI